MYNILSIGRASVFVMPCCFRAHVCMWVEGRKEGKTPQNCSTEATKVLCLQILMILRDIHIYIYISSRSPPACVITSPHSQLSSSWLQNTSCSQIVWHYNHKLYNTWMTMMEWEAKNMKLTRAINYIHWVTSNYSKFGTNQFAKRASWNA
jgi:hypothetical protein